MTKTKLAIGAALAGAALLGALAVGFVSAQNNSAPTTNAFNASEEDAIRRIVRDYLMENPEVMIESLNAYSERERANAESRALEGAKQNLSALLDDSDGYATGANEANATVAVIEFFDYHCGYCKRATPLVRDLVKTDPAVKVVFRDLPILRPESALAAKAALAAREEGKYLDLHFALMEANGVLTEARIKDIAQSAGISAAAIEKAFDDPALQRTIEETQRLAGEIPIDGTPGFVVASLNGDFVQVIPGFDPAAVAEAIAQAKKAAR